MYGLGKTFQYILASVEAEPHVLTDEKNIVFRELFQKQWG